MEYRDVETPRQLLEFMYHHIQYGFVDEDGIIYADDEKVFQKGCKLKWRLSSPERLLQVGYGHCFDVTEFERAWFLEHGYEVRTFFIHFECPYEIHFHCHAYLVFHKTKNYCFYDYMSGIYPFSSYEEAVLFQREMYIKNENKNRPLSEKDKQYIKIYEYPAPVFGCTDDEFKNHIKRNGKEVFLPKEKKYSFKIKMT